MPNRPSLIIDLFAGGGGASLGIERAIGRPVSIAINHNREAIEMHAANHPHTRHLHSDIWEVDPLPTVAGRPVDLMWASPDCRHFSKAKGAKPVSKKVRGLAWVVIRWAAAVRPTLIILENVEEFTTWGPLGDDGRPCPRRKGRTFRSWTGELRKLGYDVQWRQLKACDYGAPTTRKRFFLIARNDGQPIIWPDPTHGPGRVPYRTAAECIDWHLPCPSIFERKRPLAEKTLRRIAMGIKRYVLDNPKPFIVRCDHGGDHFRGQPIDIPLSTVTQHHGYALATPFLTGVGGPEYSAKPTPVNQPIGTLTTENHKAVVAPTLIRLNFGDKQWNAVNDPLGVVTSQGNHHALVAAFLSKYHGQKADESRCHDPSEPIRTLDTQNRVVVTTALLAKHYTGVVGQIVDKPIGTVTAVDHHSLVYAFMTKYFATGIGTPVDEPTHTQTSKPRFGLVTVTIDGQPYAISDIGLRMLTPRELARAQGFPDSYILTGTKTSQVARIGNSVCPCMSEALVRANFSATPSTKGRQGCQPIPSTP